MKTSLLSFSEPVVSTFGLRQRWNLFAPDLTRVNQFSSCLITYQDGSMRLYQWPRMDLVPVSERFKYQRVRRFVTEFWARPRSKPYWADSAQFFKRAFELPGNQVKRVEFLFNFNKIPEFKNYTKRQDLPKHYFKDTVFVYKVRNKGGIE